MLHLLVFGFLKHLQKILFITFRALKRCRVNYSHIIWFWLWQSIFFIHKTVVKLDSFLFLSLFFECYLLSTRFNFLFSILFLFDVIWQDFKVLTFFWRLFLGVLAKVTRETLGIHIWCLRWLGKLVHIHHVFSVFIFNRLQHSLWLSEHFWIKHLLIFFRRYVHRSFNWL